MGWRSEQERWIVEKNTFRKATVSGILLCFLSTLMAIFNSVVEIYKPLIKEYHTSTLMALA